jgi:PAS domain S-box-containing protein
MHQLAAAIRQDIDRLVDGYDAGLNNLPGYDHLPKDLRHDLERRVLSLIAQCLDTGDYAALVQYVRERAAQWDALGLPLTWFQHALLVPEAILTPLIASLDASNFLWQALNRSQSVVWQMVADRAHQTEERFRSIVETAHSGIMIVDDQFHFSYVNEQLTRLSGYSQAELLGADFRQLLDADSRRIVADRYARRQRGEDVTADYEIAFIRKDGEKRYVAMSVVLLRDASGKPQTVAQVLDVTERKQAEMALARERNLLHTLIDSLPDQIFFKDTEGRVILNNMADARAMGVASPAEAVGKNVFDLYPAELAELYHADDMTVIHSSQPLYNREEPGVDEAGQTRWILTTKVPLTDEQGQPIGLVGFAHDITQRRLAEQRVQELLKMREHQARTSTEVSQEIAAAPELHELFRRVVTLVKERFNYYHVQIFRYDPASNAVVLVIGYGEVGQQLLAKRHQLALGHGVVGKAAANGQTILAADVTQDADWHLNPYLPDTRGELAVPIKLRDEVLGILDVQSDRANTLTDDDRLLLEGLCGQIAIAIESTRLLEDLRHSEAQLSEALHIAKLAYWEYDVEKDLFLFNDQFYALFHTTAEQQGGYQLSSAQYAGQFVYPDDLPVVGSEIEKALNSTDRHYSRDVMHRILYADGGVGYISVSINIDRDEQGHILRYYGANQDITERQLAEEKLRESEAQLSEALKLTQLAYWEFDEVRKVFILNDQLYALLHTTAEAQGGYELDANTYVQRFIHPEDAPFVGATIARGLQTPGATSQVEARVICADGEVRWQSTQVKTQVNAAGQIIKTVGTNQDITERKLAEEAVRRSEAQLSEALKIAKLAYWEYDVEKDLFLFNDEFYSIFHTTAAQEGGYQLSSAQYAGKFVYPEDLPVVGTEIERALNSTDQHYHRDLIHRIQYADGGVGYISVSINIDRDEGGKILRYYGANQDITERQLAEEAVRHSEAQLSEALHIAKLAYWEYDVENDLFHFNDQFYALFHTTVEQVGGYQISSAQYAGTFVYPDDLSAVGTEIERALNSTDRHYHRDLVHRIQYADGGVGYISVSINIDRDEGGKILRYYGANQDITERQLAEEAVRHSEAQLSEALHIAKLAYWEYDVEKDLFLFNDQFYSIFHTTAAQEGGYQLSSAQYASKFVYPDDLPVVGAEIERALNSTDRHYSRQIDHRIQYADGGVGYIAVSINIDRDEQGHILRYYGANQDITERKQIEEALAQEQFLSSILMESVSDHIYFKDLQSRFIRISKSQADLFGLSDQAQAKGKTDFDFFTDEHARLAYEDEQRIIQTGQPITQEERETWSDQPDSWVSTTKLPLRDKSGNIVGTFGISHDITERKQAEAELERLLLEQQKRALQLQTASEVSRAASSILKLDDLLPQAVELIRARFGFYYVGIFLTDEAGRRAVLRAGTGKAGQQMLASQHWLQIGGASMISQCIVKQQARIALDVGEEALRIDNPLLPLTRSEMALPLVSRGVIIGAMTIQSDQPAAFSADDITVLQSMADQISNAVENARLYQQAQAALQEVDAINRRLTGEAWETYLHQRTGGDVIWLTDDDTAAPTALPEVDEPLTAGEITVEPDPEDGSEATVTVPILLRGEPIGALRLRTPLSEWDNDSEVMLADIAGHIAQAVENARLVEQTQRLAQRERTINEINARVRQSVDLDAILRTAVNELGQSLKATRVMARVGTTVADAAAVGDGRGKTNE